MANQDESAKIEGLRKQAKRWLKALRAGDPAASTKLHQWLPQASAHPGLREVQHALAREHGFESWAALKEHTELWQLSHSRQGLADEFLERACLSYGRDDFP